MIGLKVRLYLDGELVDDQPIVFGVGAGDLIGELGALHGDTCREADEAGKSWMIEFAFDDGEHIRFGTDPNGMVEPIPAALEHLVEALMQRHGNPMSSSGLVEPLDETERAPDA